MQNFDSYNRFNDLSVKDLLEAREMFHVHLINKKNVVATAIGRYLVRTADFIKPGKSSSAGKKPKRTLANSMVTNYSWPCILVFIEHWEEETDLVSQDTKDIIPKTLFMPDGRKVPVCIVEVDKQSVTSSEIDINNLRFPTNLIGGGFPLQVKSQGVERIATLGCIVSDGHKYYALTNKHVVGDAGEEVFSMIGNKSCRIGISSGNKLGKINFSRLYEGWGNNNMFVNCDAGLIEIENINRWKTDVLGVGQVDEIFDLNTNNISLGLIAQHRLDKGNKKVTIRGKVVGYGAGTGKMEGEIIAMFYRYKSLGGKEFVCDFLIGGRDGKDLEVHHGNSGMLWLLEVADEKESVKLQPIALHWGQHEFIEKSQKGSFSYSLATSLSNICNELDVDIVRGWNIDNDYSWGKVGHYTIGTAALQMIKNRDLKKFLENNLENISFRRSSINADLDSKKKEIKGLSKDPTKGFCALADVPDIIFKQKHSDEIFWGRYGAENPNHYADVDAPTIDGKSLFELIDSQEKLTPSAFRNYYDHIDKVSTGIKTENPDRYGLLPFRVWQVYNYMVQALKNRDAVKFLFAAGILTHYVGDACQPLHTSYMSDGNPKDDKKVQYTAKKTSYHKDGTLSHQQGDVYEKVVNPGSGVHVAYEDHMIDDNIGDILTKLYNVLDDHSNPLIKEAIGRIDSGQAAGFASLTLMKKTLETIKPPDIVELFKTVKSQGGEISTALYERFGDPTVECLTRGCCYLAAIWDSAWNNGNGSKNVKSLKKIDENKLIKIYTDPGELPSMHLDTVEGELSEK